MSAITTPSSITASADNNIKSTNKSDSVSSSSSSPAALSEDDLRKQLRSALQSLSRREPLDPTYKKLLERNTLTRKAATIPKNKFYRKIGSRLRERVEIYTREMQGKDPFDRISQRKPLDEAGMRAAFTLREAKEHEQQPLLEAIIAATAMHPERKRSLDGMALGLQQTRVSKKKMMSSMSMSNSPTFGSSSAAGASAQMSKQRAELERQKNQARQWEEARMQRERDDKRDRVEEMEQNRKNENINSGGNNALSQIIEKVFKMYWDMEFPNLDNTNPFRIVIDRKSAAYIAPDYFNVITTPMNLTYIKEKVGGRRYSTLTQFFGDIDLMIDNALKYNAQDGNPYRTAAEDLKKKHSKIVKGVWKQIKEKQSQNKS
ncbi:MAG: hypothetical protein ACI8RD_012733 [Bacillariaceae sp.]|jgi:hypothetical protein